MTQSVVGSRSALIFSVTMRRAASSTGIIDPMVTRRRVITSPAVRPSRKDAISAPLRPVGLVVVPLAEEQVRERWASSRRWASRPSSFTSSTPT
jgi:hypothetical protein